MHGSKNRCAPTHFCVRHRARYNRPVRVRVRRLCIIFKYKLLPNETDLVVWLRLLPLEVRESFHRFTTYRRKLPVRFSPIGKPAPGRPRSSVHRSTRPMGAAFLMSGQEEGLEGGYSEPNEELQFERFARELTSHVGAHVD